MTKEYEKARIKKNLERLDSIEGFSDTNIEASEESVSNMKLEECEPSTIRSYLSCISRIAHLIDFDLVDASRRELEDIAMKISQEKDSSYEDYSAWTRNNDKAALASFYKYYFDEDKERLFENIRMTPKTSDRPTLDPEQLLDTKEADNLIESASHARDKAFLAMLWDSGMRRKEIAEIRWKDVIPQQDGTIRLHIREGKNGPRTIFLYESIPWISSWFDEYPDPEPEDALWIDKRPGRDNEITPRALENIINSARKEAEIPERRKTNLHAWRKARATDLAAKGMNQPAMEEYFGWCSGSRMPRIYIQLASTDLENQVREIYGLKRKERNHRMIGEHLREDRKPEKQPSELRA